MGIMLICLVKNEEIKLYNNFYQRIKLKNKLRINPKQIKDKAYYVVQLY